MRSCVRTGIGAVLVSLSAGVSGVAFAQPPTFADVTHAAGLTYTHDYVEDTISTRHMPLAGVATGDVDRDGWPDLYVIRGSIGTNLLFRNRGDGTFEDITAAAGVGVAGDMASGPLFFDGDGDGDLDLFVGGTRGTPNYLFVNRGGGTFENRIAASGLPGLLDTFSASAGDYDRDGDIDLFLTHWHAPMGDFHLWQNDGRGVFTCVDAAAGLTAIGNGMYDFSFTAAFADLDDDTWPDLLVAGDFGTSRVFRNHRDGTFRDATTAVISDENGMGSAVGDYDNDGDLDWFVSSIFDATGDDVGGAWGPSGNRMYRNRGDGTLEDATDTAGVREGGWGWGASFVDIDNDGWLDLFHVNGWPFEVETFLEDPSRLFMNSCNGSFVERAATMGAAHTGQGRGVVCVDYDRDGDVDLFVSTYRGAPVLLRNDGGNTNAWLSLTLRGRAPNCDAIGARVTLEAGGVRQRRDVTCGNNYLSQNPFELYVGLGTSERADRIRIDWPDGAVTVLTDVAARQHLVIDEPAPAPPTAVPGGVRIVRVHPNPFADAVTVEMENAAHATVAVFDVRGRLVRTLPTGGAQSVRWDGQDALGRRVTAGVYWVRVADAATSDVRRVVIVR